MFNPFGQQSMPQSMPQSPQMPQGAAGFLQQLPSMMQSIMGKIGPKLPPQFGGGMGMPGQQGAPQLPPGLAQGLGPNSQFLLKALGQPSPGSANPTAAGATGTPVTNTPSTNMQGQASMGQMPQSPYTIPWGAGSQ